MENLTSIFRCGQWVVSLRLVSDCPELVRYAGAEVLEWNCDMNGGKVDLPQLKRITTNALLLT